MRDEIHEEDKERSLKDFQRALLVFLINNFQSCLWGHVFIQGWEVARYEEKGRGNRRSTNVTVVVLSLFFVLIFSIFSCPTHDFPSITTNPRIDSLSKRTHFSRFLSKCTLDSAITHKAQRQYRTRTRSNAHDIWYTKSGNKHRLLLFLPY